MEIVPEVTRNGMEISGERKEKSWVKQISCTCTTSNVIIIILCKTSICMWIHLESYLRNVAFSFFFFCNEGELYSKTLYRPFSELRVQKHKK